MSRPSDFRLGRLSLTILIAVSALATFVILSGGHGRTHAEIAALAALHERPGTRTVVAAAPAPAPASAEPTGDSGSDPGSGDSGAGDSGAPASADTSPAAASSDTSTTAGSGDDDSSGSGGSNGSNTTTTTPAGSNLPKVGHVFEIALSTTSYKAAFGRDGAAYLKALEHKGTLLSGYRSLGSSELADNLAVISGQAPNPDTRGGCTKYAEFPTAVVAKANGLVPGTGCVYPETALTIGDQVSASGHVWRAYIEDQGKQTCVHANSNAVDDLALPGSDPGYDSRHNPFIYFHSLLDLGDCATDDLDLTKLPAALSSASKTATFSFLAPSACGDARAIAAGGSGSTNSPSTDPITTTTTGSSTDPITTTTTSSSTTPTTTTTPTTSTSTTTGAATTPTTVGTTAVSGALGSPTAAACPAGPVAIAAENAFVKKWVPLILRSPAYKKDGVLVIALSGDGAKRSGPPARTGALVLSRYARKGKVISTSYSPYSLLRSVEDVLRYTPLAKAKSAPSFASAVLHKTD
jgi:phosphatidylinositol-3-phosphatase